MYPIRAFDPFPFLTPERIIAIESGVWSFNRDDDEITRDRRHLVQHMNAWHRAMGQRPWLFAHIAEALSDDGKAEVCSFGNMQGILFDLAHFCRFFKLHCPLDDSCVGGPRVGREPVTVRRARELPSPRLLFPSDALEDGFVPPLSELSVYDIGYYMRRREVIELYFLNQDGTHANAMQQLSMFDDDYGAAGAGTA